MMDSYTHIVFNPRQFLLTFISLLFYLSCILYYCFYKHLGKTRRTVSSEITFLHFLSSFKLKSTSIVVDEMLRDQLVQNIRNIFKK